MNPFNAFALSMSAWFVGAERGIVKTPVKEYTEMDMIDFARYVLYDKKGGSFVHLLKNWNEKHNKNF